MDIMKATIFEQNINNNLWPKIIFIMIQVNNIRLIHILKRENFYQALLRIPLYINYLPILGLTVYIFIHKEKQNLKLEKFEVQVLKNILIKYNKYIIYKVFILKQDKII